MWQAKVGTNLQTSSKLGLDEGWRSTVLALLVVEILAGGGWACPETKSEGC